MIVKADKTFEEIVERLAAFLIGPQVVHVYETPGEAEVASSIASKVPPVTVSAKTKTRK